MATKLSNSLIRTIILLLTVQLLIPVIAQGSSLFDTDTSHQTILQAKDISTFTLSIYLKESSEENEKETKKSFVSAELIDFAFVNESLLKAHSTAACDPHASNPPDGISRSMICVFLI